MERREFAVLELPPEQRDLARVQTVAAALSTNAVIELPFLKELDADELLEACRTQLRLDQLHVEQLVQRRVYLEPDGGLIIIDRTISLVAAQDGGPPTR